jgi:hypothetical protein
LLLSDVEGQKEKRMVKLPRLLAAPVLSLVLSLSLFSASAFAQNTDFNSVHNTHPGVAAQPSNALRPHDGPSPGENDYDGNGYGGNGNDGNGYGGNGYGGGYGGNYGGGGNGYGFNGGIGGGRVAGWHNGGCFSHHCGSFNRGASRCVRFSREFKSHWTLGRQGLSDCKWIKADHW